MCLCSRRRGRTCQFGRNGSGGVCTKRAMKRQTHFFKSAMFLSEGHSANCSEGPTTTTNDKAGPMDPRGGGAISPRPLRDSQPRGSRRAHGRGAADPRPLPRLCGPARRAARASPPGLGLRRGDGGRGRRHSSRTALVTLAIGPVFEELFGVLGTWLAIGRKLGVDKITWRDGTVLEVAVQVGAPI